MNRKTVVFGPENRAGEVAYVIREKVIYFTQISGVQSSINAAEGIVKAISSKEGIEWKDYQWVDIQTRPRYSEYAEDVLAFTKADSPEVIAWNPITVPAEVLDNIFVK